MTAEAVLDRPVAQPDVVTDEAALSMQDRLRQQGYYVVDLSGSDVLADAVASVAGVDEQDVAQGFAKALRSEAKAAKEEQKLGTAAARTQAAFSADAGAAALAHVPRTDNGERRQLSMLVAGVDEDGRPYGGFRYLPDPKGLHSWLVKQRPDRAAITDWRTLRPEMPADGGIVDSLVLTGAAAGRKARRNQLAGIRAARPRGASAPGRPATVYEHLATLDEDRRFVQTEDGYLPVGFNLEEALRDPNGTTLRKMFATARLTPRLARIALGIQSGRRAAKFFTEEQPVILQVLGSVAPTAAEDGTVPLDEASLLNSVREKLAVVPGTEGQRPRVDALAHILGAASLGVRNRSLKRSINTPLSAKLSSLISQPEELPPLLAPQREQVPVTGRWLSAERKQSKAARAAAEAAYEAAVAEYGPKKAAYDRQMAAIAARRRTIANIHYNGARMLTDLVKWQRDRNAWRGLPYSNANGVYTMEDVVNAAADPTLLPALHERAERARSEELAEHGHNARERGRITVGHVANGIGWVGNAVFNRNRPMPAHVVDRRARRVTFRPRRPADPQSRS